MIILMMMRKRNSLVDEILTCALVGLWIAGFFGRAVFIVDTLDLETAKNGIVRITQVSSRAVALKYVVCHSAD